MRVVIVDDHAMLRQALTRIIKSMLGYEVVGEAETGQKALVVCLKEKPNLVILDMFLPELNGIGVLRALTEKLPNTRFLLVSGSPDKALPVQLVRSGAHGFVYKTEPLNILTEAIQVVAQGGNYFMSRQGNLLQQALERRDEPDKLTSREKEVLQLIAEGMTTKQVADKLKISVKTAETHRTHLMRKLDIHDVASLTRYAIRTGLIFCDPESGP